MNAQPLAAPHTTRLEQPYQPVTVILDLAERARLAPAVASKKFERRFALAADKREIKEMEKVHASGSTSDPTTPA
jgi:hypothetical protein